MEGKNFKVLKVNDKVYLLQAEKFEAGGQAKIYRVLRSVNNHIPDENIDWGSQKITMIAKVMKL